MSIDDLDDFKRRWQATPHALTETPADATIAEWLRSSSGAFDARLRRAARVDAALKVVLLVAALAAGVVFAGSMSSLAFFAVAAAAAAVGLALQLRLLARIPRIDPAESSALAIHRVLIDYFDRYGRVSAGVHSLTAPLLFAIGSALYLSSKYGAIPPPAPDDLLVFSVGIGLAFTLHFVPLRAIQQRQHRHLNANLDELEHDALDPGRLEAHRAGSNRLRRALLVLIVAGAAMLLLFMAHWTGG